MSEFLMPVLGADMEAGTLVEWLRHPGDVLHRGDIIAIVDTAKGAIEIEVFEDGVLEHVRVNPGEKVPVGTVLATIRGAAAPAPAPITAPAPEAPAHVRASPTARKAAAELGVDLTRITGTGPEGTITREDVTRAARPVAAPPPVVEVASRAAAMRAAIAAAMTRAKRDIPHYYLSTTLDARPMLDWLRAANDTRPPEERLLPVAVLVKAVALALRDVPELNGHWVDGAFRRGSGIHIGFAVSLRGGGLVAPALHDVDGQDLATVMRGLRDLVIRARAGSLKSSELSDPTITITNLGERGADAGYGIIYPPQVAIVGFGRVAERPWVVAGRIEPRPLLTATLAADHRASDGHRGGLFLAAVERLLQAPEAL